MAQWITIKQACAQLGVQPQTIYAYVSRGKVEVAPDTTDTRRSLYRAEDIAALAKRKQAGRKHDTLVANSLFGAQPSIPTSLTSFYRGQLYYRGQNAMALSRTSCLEEIAAILWGTQTTVQFGCSEASSSVVPGRAEAFAHLGRLAGHSLSIRGRMPAVLHLEAQQLVGELAATLGASNAVRRPLHERFRSGWKLSSSVTDMVRAAQVLLADHELTSSAFVARIAASTGSSLPGCVLAGLTTLAGPLHGDASMQVGALFAQVKHIGHNAVIDQRLSAGLPLAGFGHSIYPDGDPRAEALLALFTPNDDIARFLSAVEKTSGLKPNIDAALAALVVRYRLPNDAAFRLLASARSVGLLAHSLEQIETAQMIRPRGRYVGLANY
jgi:citrate synthase